MPERPTNPEAVNAAAESARPVEEAVELDEQEARGRLNEICRALFPDLDQETQDYLAGLGIDMSLVTNTDGEVIAPPQEAHVTSLDDALNEVATLAAQYGLDEELQQRLVEAGIFE